VEKNHVMPCHGRKNGKKERPISDIYPVIDTDLARDNVENDIPAADLEDLIHESRSFTNTKSRSRHVCNDRPSLLER